ncbi:MAG: tetratricopeptide repeat protein [Candidatus Sulfotelmatobacter sp.]
MSSGAPAAAFQPRVVSRPTTHLLTASEKRSTVLCVLLMLGTLAFYHPIVHNRFTNLDDDAYIVRNPHVSSGLSWDNVKWAFTSYETGNWHPLTWLSHALDCQLFKLNPVDHHLVNVLLDAGNAILLYLLLEGATGLTWPSLMVAALFALHPMNVESVAWAAERKNVLSMFFFLLTLHAYGWYARRESVKRYAVVAALFALGLMAKPEIITLPFVLLLWDYWPLRRMDGGTTVLSSQLSVLSSRPSVLREKPTEDTSDATEPVARSFSYLLVEKIPLLLLSAGSGVITMVAQRAAHTVRDAPDGVRFGNAMVAYMRYLGKAFWPVRLAVVYPHPGPLPVWEIVASAAALILMTALVLRWRSHRYLVVGWFWFLGTLVPVIGVVQVGVQAMADRYAYIPYIGLFVCVIWGVVETVRELKVSTVWLMALAALVLLTLGMLCRRQIAYWHDSESLWRHTLSVTERNFMAHDGLGRALATQGRTEEAIAEFNASEKLAAYSAHAMVELGIYEQTHGHVQDSLGQYRQSLNGATDSKSRSIALGYMGSAFTQLGDVNRAEASFKDALQQNPDNSFALVGSGLLAEQKGDFADAAEKISRAMKVEPTDVGYLLLSRALRRAGRVVEADEARVQAQRISHDLTQAEQSADRVLASAGIRPN